MAAANERSEWSMSTQSSRIKLIQQLSADERQWQPDPADWLKEHDSMPDDTMETGGQNGERINIHKEYEIRDWTKSLRVTEEALRKAVAEVGDRADAVRAHLGKN
jgi:hypothetical protein